MVRSGKELAIFDAGSGGWESTKIGWPQDGLRLAEIVHFPTRHSTICRRITVLGIETRDKIFTQAAAEMGSPSERDGAATWSIVAAKKFEERGCGFSRDARHGGDVLRSGFFQSGDATEFL